MKTKIEETKKNENIKENLQSAILGIDALVTHFNYPGTNLALLDTARQIRDYVMAALQIAASEEE